jgi:very-short-patch-repair endonuclease
MRQPQRKSTPKPRNNTKTKLVNRRPPSNIERSGEESKKPRKRVYKNDKQKEHAEYGTSKLEEKFAKNFLDKLGLAYVYQYKMVSIGRYADFRIEPRGPIIEIQGSYWHGDKRLYEDKELNGTQRHSKFVDEIKRKWCSRNGIPLICIWEKDINEKPKEVLEYLKQILAPWIDGSINEMKKRH